jgi:hypothetical protein
MLTAARRTGLQPVAPIRRPAVTMAGPSVDTTDRRIHLQAVVSMGRHRGGNARTKKGGVPKHAPRTTSLRRDYFSAVADGSAPGATEAFGCGVGAGGGVGSGFSAFFRPRNGFTPNSASFSDRMP